MSSKKSNKFSSTKCLQTKGNPKNGGDLEVPVGVAHAMGDKAHADMKSLGEKFFCVL